MSIIPDYSHSIPANLRSGGDLDVSSSNPDQPKLIGVSGANTLGISDQKIRDFINASYRRMESERRDKRDLWQECWKLYRGREDWSDKEDWQSKIVMPKSFNSVKQATNAMMRMLQTAEMPWHVESMNPDDQVTTLRSGQLTDLTRVFLEKAEFFRAFSEGLESGFITGLGVWKIWWGFKQHKKMRVRQGPNGAKEIVRQIVEEGQIYMRAVDPYMFHWLPGSTFNNWIGTIEDIEITRPQLVAMERSGMFPPGSSKAIKGARIDQHQSDSQSRFNEPQTEQGVKGNEILRLRDYYGPIYDDEGNTLVEQAHVLMDSGGTILVAKENLLWDEQPPYTAFSPLLLPFRQEGIGLIEHTIEVDRAFNRIINMTMDKQLLGLIPVMEADVSLLESPEQLDTGLIPGKIFRKEAGSTGVPAIVPIIQDTNLSSGAQLLLGALDRAHQEGSLISEIQQALPRFRGQQTAEEISTKQGNQVDFLSALAKDIDEFALKPVIEKSLDLVMQFLDTAGDPRVGSILGIGQEYLRGLDRFQLLEMVQGDYIVRVSGVTDQIQKREQLGTIIQFMNIIGQNSEAWMPYINQTEILLRILESFQGSVRDIENIVETPETVAAKKQALASSQLTPDVVRIMPEIIRIAGELNRQAAEQALQTGQPNAGGVQQAAKQAAPQVQQAVQQEQETTKQQQERQKQLEEEQFQATIRTLRAQPLMGGQQ